VHDDAPRPDEVAATARTYVRASPLGGRGVFAAEAMAAGEVVEVAPVIVFPPEQRDVLESSALRDHWYGWTDDGDAAVAFGHASFYNRTTRTPTASTKPTTCSTPSSSGCATTWPPARS
jgi:SET domain-containing protein